MKAIMTLESGYKAIIDFLTPPHYVKDSRHKRNSKAAFSQKSTYLSQMLLTKP